MSANADPTNDRPDREVARVSKIPGSRGGLILQSDLRPTAANPQARNRQLEEENARLRATIHRLEQFAYFDHLTGLANRRSFDTTLIAETRRAARAGTCLSLALCDVDNFKQYNDNYGHVCGDAVLHDVASILLRFCRRSGDLAARYGGEEFALLLPDVGPRGAMQVAESLRRSISSHRMPGEVVPGVTISIGVSTFFGGSPATASTLVQTADKALYAAKQAGRNVTTYRATHSET